MSQSKSNLTPFYDMNAMILAAGFGTRLKPYSLLRPKPLFPILGESLLSLVLKQVTGAGAKKIVVNGHHLANQIAELVAGIPSVMFQHEKEILGTGGGLRRALPHLRDKQILVINSDIVHDIDLAAVYQHHLDHGKRVTLVMHDYPRFNNVLVRDNRVQGFLSAESQPEISETALAFTGIHVLDPEILETLPKDCFYNIINLYKQLLNEGEEINVYRAEPCFWHDIGTPNDYLHLHGELLHGRVILPWLEQLLGAKCLDFPLYVDTTAVLKKGVHLHDWVSVGRDSWIEDGSRLERCVVWDGARVTKGSYRDTLLY